MFLISSIKKHLSTHRDIKVFCLLLLLGFFNFANAFHQPFFLDDHYHYLNSKRTNLKFLAYQFIPDLTKKQGYESFDNSWGYYRPLAHILYTFQAVFFESKVYLYHLFSFIFFIIAAWSLYLFIMVFNGNFVVAFCAALLFLLHPFNGLLMNYKTAVVFSLQIIIFNFIFINLIREGYLSSRLSKRWWGFLLLLYLVSLLLHELAFVLPILFVIYIIIFPPKRKKKLNLIVFSFIFLSAIYFLIRLHYSSLQDQVLNGIIAFKITAFEFLAGYARIIRWILIHLFYPQDIFLQITTPIDKKMSVPWFFVFMTFVIITAYLLYLFKRYNRQILFFFIIFLVGFLLSYPGSYKMLGQGLLFFEPHWIFYLNTGFFVLVAFFFQFILKRNALLAYSVFILVCMSLFIFTQKQNERFSVVREYFQEWSDAMPGFYIPKSGLCGEYAIEFELDKALLCYESLLDSAARKNAVLTIAAIYQHNKEFEKSDSYFNQAIQLNFDKAFAYRGLGQNAMFKKDYNLAISYFDKAILFDQHSVDIEILKTKALVGLGQYNKALQNIENLLAFYPGNAIVLMSKLEVLLKLEMDAEVDNLMLFVLDNIHDTSILVNYTYILYINNKQSLVQALINKINQIDPQLNNLNIIKVIEDKIKTQESY